jgi:rhomboid-like protein
MSTDNAPRVAIDLVAALPPWQLSPRSKACRVSAAVVAARGKNQRRSKGSEAMTDQPSGQASPVLVPPWMTKGLRVVPVTIAVNLVVFFGWQYAETNPAFEELLIHHFLTSMVHLKLGYFWTLLTSVFSHAHTIHLLINMFVLWSFGGLLERLLGVGRLVGIYLVAGAFASVCHCVVSSFLISPDVPALGASGALSALLMAYALLFPKNKILVFGLIPMPALMAVLVFVGIDIRGLVAQGRGGGLPIGHGAHLGGTAAGALFFFAYLRPVLSCLRGPRQQPDGSIPAPELGVDEAAALLDLQTKIGREGPFSLTADERRFLRRIRDQSASP